MNAKSALAAAAIFSMDTESDLEPQGSTVEQWGEGPAAATPLKPRGRFPAAATAAGAAPIICCITRSSQHALRAHAWLQVINAAVQAWNALRALGGCAPRAITMYAGTPSRLESM